VMMPRLEEAEEAEPVARVLVLAWEAAELGSWERWSVLWWS